MKVLVIFGTPFLYGMERAVIELFDAARPAADPQFLVSANASDLHLPVFDELKRRGFRIAYFHDRRGYPTIQKTRSLHHLAQILKGLVGANLDALRASRDNDGIYIPNSLALINSVVACSWYRLRGRRVIYAFHDTSVTHRIFSYLVVMLATDVVYHANTTAHTLRTRYPVLARRTEVVIPHVVDIERGPSGRIAPAEYTGARDIVFIGQVSRHKGIDLLLAAFIELAVDFPDIALRVVGGASSRNFECQLRGSVEASGLGHRVSFLGYRNDVFEILRGAYVYVQPSRPSVVHEAFGRGVVEAMAVAVPSVVFRSGALPELVVHRETGLICDEESAPALANALRLLLENVELHERCGQGARARYNEIYSADRTTPQWRAFFREGSRMENDDSDNKNSGMYVAP
jgi:glycosyltransferase involved in cell wall biosynthesis